MTDYLQAEATAANYGFIHRLLLAEWLRLRLRRIYVHVATPRVYDLSHEITLDRNKIKPIENRDGYQLEGTPSPFPLPSPTACRIVRKGVCPPELGQPVTISGSMGASSYLLVAKGNPQFLCSASRGAGKIESPFELTRQETNRTEESLGLVGIDCIALHEERRIEEAPIAYKSIQSGINAQVKAKMVSIVASLKPISLFNT